MSFVGLSSRFDIFTAEVNLPGADNSALLRELSQLRQTVVNETIATASKVASSVAPESMAPSYVSVALGGRPKSSPHGQGRSVPINVTDSGIMSSIAHLGNGASANAA